MKPERISTDGAPAAIGAYSQGIRAGGFVYTSGQLGMTPDGQFVEGGVAEQTRASLANVKAVLAACGSSLEKVVDVTAFLVDMDRDFQGYNEVYAKHFGGIQAARTTIAIRALPTPIAVELKVVARSLLAG